MALTFKRIPDYNRTQQEVWSVNRGDKILGLLESIGGEWKAYSGHSFTCKSLGVCKSEKAAIESIVQAAAKL